jgi:hypothetical protein
VPVAVRATKRRATREVDTMTWRWGLAGSLIAFGLILVVWGVLMPREGRLIREPLPLDTQVTAFGAGADGSLLAATQGGLLWRLGPDGWREERIQGLDDRLILALPGEPDQHALGTSAGIRSPSGVVGPPGDPRVADLLETDAGLVVATSDGLWVHNAAGWHQPLPGVQAYRLGARSVAGVRDIHLGTIGNGVFSAPAHDLLGRWGRNDLGLPEGVKALSFAVTGGGSLVLGTDQGLYWQGLGGGSWSAVPVIPRSQRVLALAFASTAPNGIQSLWLGGDAGLYSLELEEREGALLAVGPVRAFRAPSEPLEAGVSAILPGAETLMLSAGGVYRLDQVRRPGWYRFVLVGLVLLIAGIGYGVSVRHSSSRCAADV